MLLAEEDLVVSLLFLLARQNASAKSGAAAPMPFPG